MSQNKNRRRIISEAINNIRDAMEDDPTVENLSRGKAGLIALATHRDLFTFEAFPLPTDDAMECSYLIHEFYDGSYALYVNSGASHQYYAPHNHGNAWAIIAGVQGRERHQLYVKNSEESDPALILHKGEFIVVPGEAVTMTADGIHEVNAMDGKPLLHLHLYARNFVDQGERWKYDLKANKAEKFQLDELGSITDAR